MMKIIYFFISLMSLSQINTLNASEKLIELSIAYEPNNASLKLFELITNNYPSRDNEIFEEGLATLYSLQKNIHGINICIDRTLPENCNDLKPLAEMLGITITENSNPKVLSRISQANSLKMNLIQELFELMAAKVQIETMIEGSFSEKVKTLVKQLSYLSILINLQDCSLPTDHEKLKNLERGLGIVPSNKSILSSMCNESQRKSDYPTTSFAAEKLFNRVNEKES